MFTRSLLYIDSKRNPQYYNKPGLKLHAIVDSLRTVISYDVSECDLHDSIFVSDLIKNNFIDDDIFYSNINNFYADLDIEYK